MKEASGFGNLLSYTLEKYSVNTNRYFYVHFPCEAQTASNSTCCSVTEHGTGTVITQNAN